MRGKRKPSDTRPRAGRTPHRAAQTRAGRTPHRQRVAYLNGDELQERGWTEALIARFLGDPDREVLNRSGRGGTPTALYRKDRVTGREQEPVVARALQRVEQRRVRKQATGRRQRERDFSVFKDYFPLARSMEQRFVFFCGPTNSGKTFHALNALCEHRSGAYLAPLRLLALEGQEEIERRGKTCSLLTGDERDLKPDARFRAQTIESLNYDEPVEAILIDEVQMLVDEQRGPHWVSALIGAPAPVIYMAGSPEALAYIEQICAYIGATLEVRRMDRLTPLHADTRTRSLRDALRPPGQKAFIVFSRQAIFELKDAVEAEGTSAAVIYGSLGPAVRRAEAERFRSGACPVLIATDAIGMGLNLPIDRLYFVTTKKWDGRQMRRLSASEVRQIAGRAGRYTKAETGFVGAVSDADFDWVQRALEQPISVLEPKPLRMGLALPLAYELADLRATESLAKVLEFFSAMKDSSGLFQPQVSAQVIRLAEVLDTYSSLAFEDKYRLALAPVDPDNLVLFADYRMMVEQLVKYGRLSIGEALADRRGPPTLLDAEQIVKRYTLRLWFAFQFADDPEIVLLEQRRDAANAIIERLLQAKVKHQRKGCRGCGRPLPGFSSNRFCQRCSARHRSV